MRANPGQISFETLNHRVKEGYVKIPQFQRDFIWSLDDSAKLIDSIIKGYPVGTFIIWNTRERLRSVRNIGDIFFPETPDGDMVKYVLDGQQRITSIIAALNGINNVYCEGKQVDFSNIYIDLEADIDGNIVITDVSGRNEESVVKVSYLLNASFQEIIDIANRTRHIENALVKFQKYRDAIMQYQFSIIEVEDASLDIATEIFTRINVGGKALNNFEIMVAKTYDENRDFDLSVKFDALISELKDADYDTISASSVLQSIALCTRRDVRSCAILSISRTEFIDAWVHVTDALKSTIDYFRNVYGVPVSTLLPYDALLVLFTYFFYKHPQRPIGRQNSLLKDYFWRAVLSERFSSSSDSKINSDVSIIDSIINETEPNNRINVDMSLDYIKKHGGFSTSSAFIKGVLCLLASKKPVSFIDGAEVTIDNSWLKQANSRNYHHFFPRAFMRRNHPEIAEDLVNHIANITIVDAFLNKKVIRDRAPSAYILDFRTNPDLGNCLETHLITYNDADDSGINSDDYNDFFEKRLKRIRNEFKNRIIESEEDRIE